MWCPCRSTIGSLFSILGGVIGWTIDITLGSTDSCATAVNTKRFSTSVFLAGDVAGVFATTTKIYTDGSKQGSRSNSSVHIAATSYTSGLHGEWSRPKAGLTEKRKEYYCEEEEEYSSLLQS
ncbi:hypothetical protein APICC_05373 [Apis cerana cerana]|uniref:Uncharacterized protein n=1 Tax=Apis cerana cerana TaxID=94128 RepID=A0A2A3E224_APICC|nr:hypothetical protein APICC_05373 [Apis cerana cerana]